MQFSISVLASGSGGNSLVVSTEHETILIDAGLSARQLTLRLRQSGFDLEKISALLVTHEHTDHIYGASTIANRWNIPVYGTTGTLSRLRLKEPRLYMPISNMSDFAVGSLEVRSFPVPHDARDPVGFIISTHGRSLGIATDLGHFSTSHAEMLKQCSWIVLESNHDPKMLESGPYPPFLKARIKGNNGHLSNEQAATALRLIAPPRLSGVILAHLSEKNNTRDLAELSVMNTLRSMDMGTTMVTTAAPNRPVGPFNILES